MLGKLTRWLRLLGHDIKYFNSLEDTQLIKIAKEENRTLLTRDLELFQQAMTKDVNTFVVEGETEAEKLANLAKQFELNLKIDVNVSRCPKCNTKIRYVSKDLLIDRIPKGTFSNYDKFWECPSCGQTYWQGAHWKRIGNTLREARQTLKKLKM